MVTTGTSWVAIYAAIVATASFSWNVVLSRRDVGRLSLVGNLAVKLENGFTRYHQLTSSITEPLDKEACFLRVVVTNTGRRPMTLHYWAISGIGKSKPAEGFATKPTLAESQSWEITLEDLGDFRYNAARLFVMDSHGRNWPLPPEQLANLRDAMLRNRL